MSMMQRIGSVFLISFRVTLTSRASRLKTPWPPFFVQLRFDHQILQDTLWRPRRSSFDRRLTVRGSCAFFGSSDERLAVPRLRYQP